MNSLAEQVSAFGIMIVAGLVTGFLYDFYRVGRGRIISAGSLGTFLGDLVYSLVAASAIYYFLIIGSWGQIRLYLLLAVLSGLVIYFALFSRFALRFFIVVIHLLSKGTRLASAGAKNTYYQGCNLGMRMGRKVGMDKLVLRGQRKMGALRGKFKKLKPEFRWKRSKKTQQPKGEVRLSRRERPKVAKRVNKTARFLSARSKNLIRGIGRSIKIKG